MLRVLLQDGEMDNQQRAHEVWKETRLSLPDRRKHSTSNAYDRWSRVWNLARYTNCSIYETALSLLDERHGKVLDVGCGTGVMSARLAMSGRQVIGVDLSPAMIDRARRKEHSRLEFVQGDAENLPIESGSFDAVVNLISFHHYPTPARAIAEFRRVLRSNGRLVLIAFDRESRYIQLAQRTNRWTRWIAGQSWQKTSEEVIALVSDAGFARVELKTVRYWIQTFAIVAE
jgi:ubiquinone/menaquinone biosynthesis C-methylase UbiE